MTTTDDERNGRILAIQLDGATTFVATQRFGLPRSRTPRIAPHPAALDPRVEITTRFPGMLPSVAARLAARFPDDESVRAATDEELMSVRNLGPARRARVRELYPRRVETGPERATGDRSPRGVNGAFSTDALCLSIGRGSPAIRPSLEPLL